MAEGGDVVGCAYEGQHPRIAEQLEQLEGREDKQDAKLDTLAAGQAGIREEIAGMRGEVRGALLATKMSGAIVGGLVSFGGACFLAFVGWLATKR